jgi:hypothetical protein
VLPIIDHERKEVTMHLKRRKSLVVALLIALSPAAFAQEGQAVEQARQAAASWLALLDRSDYAGTWNEAADSFKAALSSAAWTSAASAARKPLGEIKSRAVTSATYTRSLPGAPPGEYVVIVYASAFENRPSAQETVTPMRDKDGVWRVSGYFVK